MDPDMVRQQEEAEEEARRLKTGQTAAAPGARVAVPPPPKSEPVTVPREEETETILAHVHVPGLPPVIPVKRKKKRPAPPAEPGSRLGWFVALRVSLYSLILGALGLLGGMALGAKLGLPSMQSFAVGAGLGFLFGWQAAFASMRANRAVSFMRAVLISTWPALIVLAVMIVALLSAQNVVGQGTNAATDSNFWLIAAIGALVALILSTLQTRKLTT